MNTTIGYDEKIEIYMKEQLLEWYIEAINMIQDKITSLVSSPANQNILFINEYTEGLNESKYDIFHSVT